MSEFSSERRMTSAALDQRRDEMRDLLQEIAGPVGLVKARIRAAARSLGWSYSRTKDLWYGDPRTRVDLPEILQARTTAGTATRSPVEADLERLRALKDEVAELRFLMATTLSRMAGASIDQREHLGARPGKDAGHRSEAARVLNRSVAGGSAR